MGTVSLRKLTDKTLAREEEKLAQRAAHPRPALGTRVSFVAHVTKLHSGGRTLWNRATHHACEGMYIGYRTVYEGRMMGGGVTGWDEPIEEPPYFEPSDSLEVWLVVTDPRYNPVRVLPQDVTLVAC